MAQSGESLGPLQAAIVVSPEEEAMGREFIAAARKQLAFIEDPLLARYVETLGRRLAGRLEGDTASLRFFLIESRLVNAFAGPGGRLAIFTGLMTTTRTEAELASVMAHELGHVAQRHLPRMMDRASRRQLPTTAGILAAILLGGQAGAAAMAATTGAAMSDQLRYNREFEREADVLGLTILTDAGYPAAAMIDFLKRLDQENRLQSAEVPEYLRTHPLTQNRLALVESRLRQYGDVADSPSLDYHHAHARVRAMFEGPAGGGAMAEFLHQAESEDPLRARAARYGLVLAFIKQGDHERALGNAAALRTDYPDYPLYAIVLAEALLADGQADEAVAVLESTEDKGDISVTVAYYLGDALMKSGQLGEARRRLRTALRRAPTDAALYKLLARVEGERDQWAQSFQALAEYHFLRDETDQALGHLQTAATHSADSAYLKASIDARIKEIERILGKTK
ncbi:MAG TPA: hypothetical protein DG761_00130 [Gammaproteobacteria bacterium]|nr:hypothetical protein [Acidiferrobacteraceae bacterium]MDP6551890.1 M48 family metalloprotease [Arenicellales bacterium]MDP6791385.1 M48 family metalloprotease [Arenicellales bacterium]HCX86410.1 hypothetical protein [Gammaproteobacteria bacterium]